MSRLLVRNVAWLVSFLAVIECSGESSLMMPGVGRPLPAGRFELVNQIPAARLAELPRMLPTFVYVEKPRLLQAESLQSLLEQSAFSGTNIAELLRGRASDTFLRLATPDSRDYFVVYPMAGRIALVNRSRDVDLRREKPPADGVPSFDVIRNRLLAYAKMFGVSTNDMDRNADGSLHMGRTERKTSRFGGQVKFIQSRSGWFSRSIGAYTVRGNDNKITLELGVDGRLLKFELKWPSIDALGTNRVLTITQVLAEIDKGRVLADVTNEYPSDGFSEVLLKDIYVEYYDDSSTRRGRDSTSSRIFPVASFRAVFKSRSGKTEEGGLFAPIIEE